MEKKTAKGLVDWALAFVGNPYWYGTCCYPCTNDLLKSKSKQYPSHYTQDRMERYRDDIEKKKMCADCVGLIKGYLWDDGGKRKYDAATDLSADGMYNACDVCGSIDTMPDVPGLLVWQKGHIGVYVGNGEAVEARGFAYGCRVTEIADRTWTHWGQCKYISYGQDVEAAQPVSKTYKLLAKGSRGEEVKLLQSMLAERGYAYLMGEVDGIFGDKTRVAVKAYQTDNGLEVDGIVGEKTWTALLEKPQEKVTVTITGLTKAEAAALVARYPQTKMMEE